LHGGHIELARQFMDFLTKRLGKRESISMAVAFRDKAENPKRCADRSRFQFHRFAAALQNSGNVLRNFSNACNLPLFLFPVATGKKGLDYNTTRFNPALRTKSIMLSLKQETNACLELWRIHYTTGQ
jgi:hypothetical protein